MSTSMPSVLRMTLRRLTSSLSSRMRRALGSSLTMALQTMFLARSAYLHIRIEEKTLKTYTLKNYTCHKRVCSMETSISMLIPPISSHSPFCRMQIGWSQWAREHGLGSKATFPNFILCTCPFDPLNPYSAIQCNKIELGISVELLVSVPQTHSL